MSPLTATHPTPPLIPPPVTVRAELARNIRERRRLRSLLRLALQVEEDRRFLRSLAEGRAGTTAPGVAS